MTKREPNIELLDAVLAWRQAKEEQEIAFRLFSTARQKAELALEELTTIVERQSEERV